jgi:hypothetical protein
MVDTSHVQAVVAGQPGQWSVVGNMPETVNGRPAHCCGRILRVMVVMHGGNGSDQDGAIAVDY